MVSKIAEIVFLEFTRITSTVTTTAPDFLSQKHFIGFIKPKMPIAISALL